MRSEVSKHIRSDAVSKIINTEKQNRHDRKNSGYVTGRSYLLDGVDPQILVNDYHGTGRAGLSKDGVWNNRETVTADRDIGINVDQKTGEETLTDRFTIHYSGTGVHIVPAKRRR